MCMKCERNTLSRQNSIMKNLFVLLLLSGLKPLEAFKFHFHFFMEHLAIFILYVGCWGLPWDVFLRPFCVFSPVKNVASIFNKNCVYSYIICLEAFAATDFNKVFSGRQPRQTVKFLHRSRDWLLPHIQSATDDLTKHPTNHRAKWKQVDVPQSV